MAKHPVCTGFRSDLKWPDTCVSSIGVSGHFVTPVSRAIPRAGTASPAPAAPQEEARLSSQHRLVQAFFLSEHVMLCWGTRRPLDPPP